VPERATSDEAELFARVFRPLYQIMRGKFFFDEMYTALVVWPLRAAAAACSVVDRYLVDGVVNAVGRIPPLAGASMRPLQGGLLQFYALAMVLGLLVLALGLFVRGA
jgi:NADH-quinone oxidoreductase subunit L